MHTPHPREACYFGIKWVSHSIFPFPLFLERQVPVPAHRAGNGHAVSSHTALGSQPPGEHCCSLPPLGISLVQSPPSRPHRAPLAVGSQSLLMLFHNRYLRDATGPAPAPDVLWGGSRIWPWMQKGAHQHNGPPWALAFQRNHRMQPTCWEARSWGGFGASAATRGMARAAARGSISLPTLISFLPKSNSSIKRNTSVLRVQQDFIIRITIKHL